MSRALVLVALVVLLGVLGCPGGSDKKADSAEETRPAIRSREDEPTLGKKIWTIRPGYLAEVDFVMKKGKKVYAKYRGDGRMLIDAHVHYGKETITYWRILETQGWLEFTAPEDGMFSFLWAHADGPEKEIVLDVELKGEAVIDAWIPR